MIPRREFLRQLLAFSAAAAARPAFAAPLTPLPIPKGAAQALVLGDWGWLDVIGPNDERAGVGFAAQSQVARGMAAFVRQQNLHADALFLLGDSWYGDLPGGAASPRWLNQFENMYPASLFPGPAYTMLGNHDYQRLPPSVDKVEAELEYARTGRGPDGKPTRWHLPSRWYTFDFPAHDPHMRVIVLDSNMPYPDGKPAHGASFTLTPAQQAEQLAWLKVELARPRTLPFLAVLAHHPIYSNGPHGDHPILVRDWAPLLSQYKVDLYMAGHDHDLQVLEFDGHPTTHVLSGGGGADLYVLAKDDLDRGPYAQETHGFSHLAVTSNTLQVRHLDSHGRTLFALEKLPGGKSRILPA